MKTVGIVGLGNVGITLTNFLLNKDFNSELELIWVCSKHFTDLDLLRNTAIYRSVFEIKSTADFIFICTKDGDIQRTCSAICMHWQHDLLGKYIIHTAGSLDLEVLAECAQYGGLAVAAHPFQTFASHNPASMNNIAWGIEAAATQQPAIATLIKKLNGKPYFLSPEICRQKALYHIVAVATSNYLTAAIKYGTTIADKININKTDFLIPIIEETVKNCVNALKTNADIPLTGPIARNDNSTITKHIAALGDYPTEQQIYKAFANVLTQLNNQK